MDYTFYSGSIVDGAGARFRNARIIGNTDRPRKIHVTGSVVWGGRGGNDIQGIDQNSFASNKGRVIDTTTDLISYRITDKGILRPFLKYGHVHTIQQIVTRHLLYHNGRSLLLTRDNLNHYWGYTGRGSVRINEVNRDALWIDLRSSKSQMFRRFSPVVKGRRFTQDYVTVSCWTDYGYNLRENYEFANSRGALNTQVFLNFLIQWVITGKTEFLVPDGHFVYYIYT